MRIERNHSFIADQGCRLSCLAETAKFFFRVNRVWGITLNAESGPQTAETDSLEIVCAPLVEVVAWLRISPVVSNCKLGN